MTAYIPTDPKRIRIVLEVDVEVTDREALLAAALEHNDDLYASDTITALRQLVRVDDTVPGIRVMGGSTLPRWIDGDEYPAFTLPSMPVQ